MQEYGAAERVRLGTVRELDPVKTFECGQCFRWNAEGDGAYFGVAGDRAARLVREGDEVFLLCGPGDFDGFWRNYFDLERDYGAVSRSFGGGDYLRRCCAYGEGIRILRQDAWEALCSFILSQCNNIPRIKRLVETLCACFGEEREFAGRPYHTFPSAETLAVLEPEDLAPLRCGYRAPYVTGAARAVAAGEPDLAALAAADLDTAMTALTALEGVGVKVASCAALFGLGHLEAFPVDVWMKRALKEHFPPGFDPKTLGPCAGLAQQYIFYYARSGGNTGNV